MPKLTEKQMRFCHEYTIDLNAKQAAIRSGYAKNSAEVTGSKLLSNAKVKDHIADLIQERNQRTGINADYVLNRLTEIDQMDVIDILNCDGELKPINEWPKVWRTSLSGIDISVMLSGDSEMMLKKIKWPDKVKNLELLGKHISVNAFTENKNVKLKGQIAVTKPLSTLFEDDDEEEEPESENTNNG